MTKEFQSVESAQAYVATTMGLDPKITSFEEVEELQVIGLPVLLLDDPNTPNDIKEEIKAKLAAQKGFKFQHPEREGEIQIVIGPFRSGFDCWIVSESGHAIRL